MIRSGDAAGMSRRDITRKKRPGQGGVEMHTSRLAASIGPTPRTQARLLQ